MGPKEDCCICPIPSSLFWTPFAAMCLLKLWFFRNCLSQRLATSAIGFGMPWTLNMHHSNHFDAFSQSKSTKCEIAAVSWTPPNKKLKKCQFAQGKSVGKGLQICTYRFLGMPIAMIYVRTLCDKYFLSYYAFSTFLWEGLDIGFWNMV